MATSAWAGKPALYYPLIEDNSWYKHHEYLPIGEHMDRPSRVSVRAVPATHVVDEELPRPPTETDRQAVEADPLTKRPVTPYFTTKRLPIPRETPPEERFSPTCVSTRGFLSNTDNVCAFSYVETTTAPRPRFNMTVIVNGRVYLRLRAVPISKTIIVENNLWTKDAHKMIAFAKGASHGTQ